LLEIGPGTGQATKGIAAYGFDITAIELGPQLAAIARAELQSFPNVSIITGAFEEIPLPDNVFDLVFAATAIHWIAADARYAKPHRILKPTGYMAIIETHHVSDAHGDGFFEASQPLFDRYQFSKPGERPPMSSTIQPAPIDNSLFTFTNFHSFPMEVTYSASAFIDLLGTYSNILAATQERRESLLSEIGKLIDDRFQGKVTKQFLMSLTIAQRKE
jgi:SAM-dependent methyltransferase